MDSAPETFENFVKHNKIFKYADQINTTSGMSLSEIWLQTAYPLKAHSYTYKMSIPVLAGNKASEMCLGLLWRHVEGHVSWLMSDTHNYCWVYNSTQ